MVIFGTSLLAICFVVGMYLGDLLGVALGVKANVGGVGLAMILLIFAKMWLESKKLMPKATEAGVGYWYWSDKVESMMLRCEMYAATEKAAKEVRTAWEKH